MRAEQSAEYRNVASIMMVIKQGTNQFHGLAYEFVQTGSQWNTFLLNATGSRGPISLNQFGVDLGGPSPGIVVFSTALSRRSNLFHGSKSVQLRCHAERPTFRRWGRPTVQPAHRRTFRQ